jgi:hypothetical protein
LFGGGQHSSRELEGLSNPTFLSRSADDEYGRKINPSSGENEMDFGFGLFAAPEVLRKDKPLHKKADGPKDGERPGQPRAGSRFFEEDPWVGQAREAHQDEDQADEKRVHSEDGGVDWA